MGEIDKVEGGRVLDGVDVNDGSLFTIELNERVYTLKADSAEEAAKWVRVLNTLKFGGVTGKKGNGNEGGLADIDKSQRGGCLPCFTICGK